MKKFLTAVGTVALLTAAVIPAFGAGNSCTNGTTGPASNNTCLINNSTTVTVNNVNDAQIVNDIEVRANTGRNSASNNTLGGNITTGNASLNTTVSNVANINTTNISVGWAGSNNLGANEITGPFSYNSAWINNAQDVDVYNSNTATVYNDVDAKADTGKNRADNNTGPAFVRTGSADLMTGVFTHVNDNWTALSLGAGGSGNNTAYSNTTGPFSNNTAAINNTTDLDVNNVNDLQVVNDVYVRARTGRNSASNNTLGGAIDTGDAGVGLDVGTEGNINTTLIAAVFGGFNNDAGNSVTGPGDSSVNNAWINNERVITFDNWNNKCQSHNAPYRDWERNLEGRGGYDSLGGGDHGGDNGDHDEECDVNDLGVLNDVYAKSDAGKNKSDNNTGGGTVMAGWASLVQSVLTHLNDVVNDIQL